MQALLSNRRKLAGLGRLAKPLMAAALILGTLPSPAAADFEPPPCVDAVFGWCGTEGECPFTVNFDNLACNVDFCAGDLSENVIDVTIAKDGCGPWPTGPTVTFTPAQLAVGSNLVTVEVTIPCDPPVTVTRQFLVIGHDCDCVDCDDTYDVVSCLNCVQGRAGACDRGPVTNCPDACIVDLTVTCLEGAWQHPESPCCQDFNLSVPAMTCQRHLVTQECYCHLYFLPDIGDFLSCSATPWI